MPAVAAGISSSRVGSCVVDCCLLLIVVFVVVSELFSIGFSSDFRGFCASGSHQPLFKIALASGVSRWEERWCLGQWAVTHINSLEIFNILFWGRDKVLGPSHLSESPPGEAYARPGRATASATGQAGG